MDLQLYAVRRLCKVVELANEGSVNNRAYRLGTNLYFDIYYLQDIHFPCT